ncbi:MAG: hypothetical protein EXR66_02490 [Dehalococcoidia bacterium]|nr:hypothetical protein [Dehalococcoidia bacterium]
MVAAIQNFGPTGPEAATSPYDGFNGDPCNDGDLRTVIFGPAQSRLRPLDAEPLFEMKAGLRVTYAVAP